MSAFICNFLWRFLAFFFFFLFSSSSPFHFYDITFAHISDATTYLSRSVQPRFTLTRSQQLHRPPSSGFLLDYVWHIPQTPTFSWRMLKTGSLTNGLGFTLSHKMFGLSLSSSCISPSIPICVSVRLNYLLCLFNFFHTNPFFIEKTFFFFSSFSSVMYIDNLIQGELWRAVPCFNTIRNFSQG